MLATTTGSGVIRTICPKCGREDAVADYLAPLPILCNGCGARVTMGEAVAARPLLPPPVARPPKAVVPPPPPPAPRLTPPPPPKAVVPPPPVVPLAVPVSVPDELVQVLDEVAPPPVELAAAPPPAPAAPPPKAPPAPKVAKRPPAPAAPAEPALVGRRLFARLLTLLGLALMAGLGFGLLVLLPLPKATANDPLVRGAVVAVFPLIYLLVNAAMLARTGQDVGKRYTGLRVVNADGSKATEKSALLLRDALTFALGLTGVGLLYWLIDFATLFGKGGRCLHDKIAGTRVVRA